MFENEEMKTATNIYYIYYIYTLYCNFIVVLNYKNIIIILYFLHTIFYFTLKY